jgi:hypothetical protein
MCNTDPTKYTTQKTIAMSNTDPTKYTTQKTKTMSNTDPTKYTTQKTITMSNTDRYQRGKTFKLFIFVTVSFVTLFMCDYSCTMYIIIENSS